MSDSVRGSGRRPVGRWWSVGTVAVVLLGLAGAGTPVARPPDALAATAAYTIYDDALATGWQEWSSRQTDVQLGVTSPVYAGSRAMAFTIMRAAARLYLHASSPLDLTPYSVLHFAAQAAQPGQHYSIQVLDANEKPLVTVPLGSVGGDPPVGSWQVYDIPLSALGATNRRSYGLTMLGQFGTSQPALYLDEIELRPTMGTASQPTATATRPPNAPTATPQPPLPTATGAARTPTPPLTATATAPGTGATTWPRPPLDRSWQWQIDGKAIDLGPAQRGETRVYDVDYEYATAPDVANLHALNQFVVCYMDIGAWESYRPDASQFPASVIGGSTGWNGEKYLDIRSYPLFAQILLNRFDLARGKSCDAVEGDYQNNLADDQVSTWAGQVTLAQQEAFNQWFIQQVHARGMAAVLKNAPERAARWAAWPDATHPQGYDAALNEECNRYSECSGYDAFVQSSRPVWQAEYTDHYSATVSPPAFCAADNQHGFNGLLKNKPLDAWRLACR